MRDRDWSQKGCGCWDAICDAVSVRRDKMSRELRPPGRLCTWDRSSVNDNSALSQEWQIRLRHMNSKSRTWQAWVPRAQSAICTSGERGVGGDVGNDCSDAKNEGWSVPSQRPAVQGSWGQNQGLCSGAKGKQDPQGKHTPKDWSQCLQGAGCLIENKIGLQGWMAVHSAVCRSKLRFRSASYQEPRELVC